MSCKQWQEVVCAAAEQTLVLIAVAAARLLLVLVCIFCRPQTSSSSSSSREEVWLTGTHAACEMLPEWHWNRPARCCYACKHAAESTAELWPGLHINLKPERELNPTACNALHK
jgi:hypothetical protein